MVKVTLPKRLYSCKVSIDGHLLNGVTDNFVHDGMLIVKISHFDAYPIADKLTVATMGIDFKDIKYLEVLRPVNEVQIEEQ